MLKTWMIGFVEDNKIISGFDKTITEPEWKIKFKVLPVIRGCRKGDNFFLF